MNAFENNEVKSMPLNDEQMRIVLKNFGITDFIRDSDKHFYARKMAEGFKICECTSCQVLVRPILIKDTRNCEEYEILHKVYL